MNNNVEESVSLFESKCAKIDLPPAFYPDSQFLRKIFRQRLSLFELFIRRVDTKYSVGNIRKNILIAHMNNSIKDTNVNSYPEEYKKYIKYNEMIEKIKDLKEKQRYIKQEEKQKLETIQKNDLKIIKSKEISRLNRIKVDLLQAKLININRDIDDEQDLEKKIKDVTPATFSSSDSIENFCKNISESIEILKQFSAGENNDASSLTKDKFWKKIESVLKNVPNSVIFQTIIKEISSRIGDSILTNFPSTSEQDQPIKISEKLLPYLHQIKIISGIELAAQRKKLESNKKACAENIQVFENEVESILNSSINYSLLEDDDDIVGEFVSALIAKVNLEGKIQYCTNYINAMKQQVENNSTVHEYEQLVSDTRNIYNFINEKMTAIQEHVYQVHQINEKVNFSKISAMRMIQSLKIEKTQQHNRNLLNQTLNNTVIANSKEGEVSLPNHEYELQQFLETPIIHFDKSLTTTRFFILNNEEIISNIIQIAGHFISPHKFLDLLGKRIKFGNHIKSISEQVASQIETIADVNSDEIQKQRTQNIEEISIMFDEISKLNVSINNNFRHLELLFNYSLENPLKKFVPKTKKFDGKTYEAFEKEYMLYYKMISN